MANSAQSKKRARQADKRGELNASQRSTMRTAMKKVINAVAAGDKEAATTAYKTAVPAIDHGVSQGLIHKNAAARYKSRMNNQLRAL